jgi:hypothetical protein
LWAGIAINGTCRPHRSHATSWKRQGDDRDCPKFGGMTTTALRSAGYIAGWGSRMEWVLRLIGTGVDGQSRSFDVIEISRPDGFGDIADLGLTLAEGKRLLAEVQQVVVAAQSDNQATIRPSCRSCGRRCHVKDWRLHRNATLFGEVRVSLPRFLCAGCGRIEIGLSWPSHCRSTPELDQLQARLSALMPYRVAADVMQHLLPIDASRSPETLRSHTLQVGKRLGDAAAEKPQAAATAITISLDQPSYAAAKTANATWRSGSATSRRLVVAARFLAPSPRPKPTSPR